MSGSDGALGPHSDVTVMGDRMAIPKISLSRSRRTTRWEWPELLVRIVMVNRQHWIRLGASVVDLILHDPDVGRGRVNVAELCRSRVFSCDWMLDGAAQRGSA